MVRNMKLTIVVNILTFFLLLFSPFLASGDWAWGLGWVYTGSMILHTLVSRAIAIRLHPGFARERATAGAMQQANTTLSTVDHAAAPNASLDQAMKDLASAAKSLRVLADYLERHPDALLYGKTPNGD